jgi:hypothetical protein
MIFVHLRDVQYGTGTGSYTSTVKLREGSLVLCTRLICIRMLLTQHLALDL